MRSIPNFEVRFLCSDFLYICFFLNLILNFVQKTTVFFLFPFITLFQLSVGYSFFLKFFNCSITTKQAFI